ncbi:hypothetical protein J3459_016128 [Metarhizium acridum]|uniref:uncharacterized protein n=1 Tax=Metarhizium acridum TaxID=92637 RepID=UPI001C6C7FAD|nr:hypothetical protein J3458_020444 [Metarhizium acridum]KAG8411990.1 hypothetical protein J3459_016128 [Metarhizium acridum]KAG8421898.1 hypothetical protein J3458_003734 [Metarhizium acridum]
MPLFVAVPPRLHTGSLVTRDCNAGCFIGHPGHQAEFLAGSTLESWQTTGDTSDNDRASTVTVIDIRSTSPPGFREIAGTKGNPPPADGSIPSTLGRCPAPGSSNSTNGVRLALILSFLEHTALTKRPRRTKFSHNRAVVTVSCLHEMSPPMRAANT